MINSIPNRFTHTHSSFQSSINPWIFTLDTLVVWVGFSPLSPSYLLITLLQGAQPVERQQVSCSTPPPPTTPPPPADRVAPLSLTILIYNCLHDVKRWDSIATGCHYRPPPPRSSPPPPPPPHTHTHRGMSGSIRRVLNSTIKPEVKQTDQFDYD